MKKTVRNTFLHMVMLQAHKYLIIKLVVTFYKMYHIRNVVCYIMLSSQNNYVRDILSLYDINTRQLGMSLFRHYQILPNMLLMLDYF